MTYSNSRFLEVQPHGKSLSHEDIGVMTGLERSFQLFQLPSAEVGSRATAFARWIIQIGICKSQKINTNNVN